MFRLAAMSVALCGLLISCASERCSAVEPIPTSAITIEGDLYNPGYFVLSWHDEDRDAYFDLERFDGCGWSRATPWPMQQCTWCNGLQAGLYRIRSQSLGDEFDVSYSQSVWVPFEIWWFP